MQHTSYWPHQRAHSACSSSAPRPSAAAVGSRAGASVGPPPPARAHLPPHPAPAAAHPSPQGPQRPLHPPPPQALPPASSGGGVKGQGMVAGPGHPGGPLFGPVDAMAELEAAIDTISACHSHASLLQLLQVRACARPTYKHAAIQAGHPPVLFCVVINVNRMPRPAGYSTIFLRRSA